jgi:predicted ATPase
VATVIESAIGLNPIVEDAKAQLIDHLRGRRAPLILDCCEHVIEAVASFAEVLATSREALRVDLEQVQRLEPLECSPDRAELSTADVMAFLAAQLFVERMKATGFVEELHDGDTLAVADFCRRLDGIALALELAAREVATYGITRAADLL